MHYYKIKYNKYQYIDFYINRVSKFGIWQRICSGFLQGEAIVEAAPYF